MLDFGCGTGYDAALMAMGAKKVTGLDIDAAALAWAAEGHGVAVLAVNAQSELNRSETLPNGTKVSPHTQSQARALTQNSNTFFTVAAASAGAAAALGVTAVLVW